MSYREHLAQLILHIGRHFQRGHKVPVQSNLLRHQIGDTGIHRRWGDVIRFGNVGQAGETVLVVGVEGAIDKNTEPLALT